MTDYLALAREHADAADRSVFGTAAYDGHHLAAGACASIAVAEALTALTLPQGIEDVASGAVTPAPSPAEPHAHHWCDPNEPSLVALDRTEVAYLTAREAAERVVVQVARRCAQTFDNDAFRQPPEWWAAQAALCVAVADLDRIGGAA